MNFQQLRIDVPLVTTDIWLSLLSYLEQPTPRQIPFLFLLRNSLQRTLQRQRAHSQWEFTYDIGVVFSEHLRTAQVLDDSLSVKLNSLVNLQSPPEAIFADTSDILDRLLVIFALNPLYLESVQYIIQPIKLVAESTFNFPLDDDFSLDGFHFIVAVGLLAHLRITCISVLGWEGLPPFHANLDDICKYCML